MLVMHSGCVKLDVEAVFVVLDFGVCLNAIRLTIKGKYVAFHSVVFDAVFAFVLHPQFHINTFLYYLRRFDACQCFPLSDFDPLATGDKH